MPVWIHSFVSDRSLQEGTKEGKERDARLVVARGGNLLGSKDSEEVADDFERRVVVMKLQIPLVLLRERFPIITGSHQSPVTTRERM